MLVGDDQPRGVQDDAGADALGSLCILLPFLGEELPEEAAALDIALKSRKAPPFLCLRWPCSPRLRRLLSSRRLRGGIAGEPPLPGKNRLSETRYVHSSPNVGLAHDP